MLSVEHRFNLYNILLAVITYRNFHNNSETFLSFLSLYPKTTLTINAIIGRKLADFVDFIFLNFVFLLFHAMIDNHLPQTHRQIVMGL